MVEEKRKGEEDEKKFSRLVRIRQSGGEPHDRMMHWVDS